MIAKRFPACLLAAFALLAAHTAAARPGDLDPSFGTGGIQAPAPFPANETLIAATGTAERWVVGNVNRGGATHLFVAKFAADGTLDTTFGTNGKSMLRWNEASNAAAIARQGDGKLVVVGSAWVGSITKMLVARFNADGSLDTAFGTNGITTVNPFGYSGAAGLSIAPDGKIVVAGTVTSGSSDMVVFRLTSSGALDPAFGTNGVKTIDFRGGGDYASGVQVLGGGKIIVAGSAAQSSANANLDAAVTRLNSDGTVDTTFGPPGHNGLALHDVGGAYDSNVALGFYGSSIVMGGSSTRVGQTASEFAVLRLTSEGLRDATFGTDGAAFVAGTNSLYAGRMVVQADGKVVVASSGPPTFARLTTAGVLDPAFGTNGIFVEPETSIAYVGDILANGDGTFTCFGGRQVTAPTYASDALIVRYTVSGSRDGSFGTNGIASTNLFTVSLDARAVALGPTGAVFVAGLLSDAYDMDAAVTRFTAAGAPDTFGVAGVAAVPFGASDEVANALVVLADGSVVVAGRQVNLGTGSFLLARFNQYGQLDTATFGFLGKTVHTMGIGYAEAYALAQQPDGKLVAAGYAVVGSGNNDFALARYTANGQLDATFGTGGVVVTPFGALSDVAQAVAIQADGKIVAAGYMRTGNLFDIAVARYNANGTLDATFGTGGKAVIPASASNDQGAAVAITREGKILVAGIVLNGANENIGVVRLSALGVLDSTFATGGVASVDVAGGADRAWGMALQRNGKIVLAGQAFDGAGNAFVAVRLNDDGSRDARFGLNGVKTIDAGPSSDFGRAVAVQPDGRIVVAGTAGTNVAVVRLLGDPRKVTQSDANNDVRDDLYWRDGGTGLSWWLMDGAAILDSAFLNLGAEWQLLDTGDFNGDGKADLVWRNTVDGTVYVWMLDGTAVTAAESPGALGPEWALVGAADLDGNGRSDLVWRNSTTGELYGWLMSGGTIVSQGTLGNPGTEWQVIDFADFSGDGKADILWRRTLDGYVYTWWMNGLNITAAFSMAVLDPAQWLLVAAGDLNADGIADLIWRSTAGDTWVWLYDELGNVTAGGLGNPGSAWSIRAVGDFDGDGRDDLLWRHTDGSGYLWALKGASVKWALPVANPGGTWQIVAP